MNERNRPLAELQNNEWLLKLSFYTDLIKQMNDLYLKLQGEKQVLPYLYTHIKSFRQKISIEQKNVSRILIHAKHSVSKPRLHFR